VLYLLVASCCCSAAVINDATAPKPTPDTATPSGPDTAAETAAGGQQECANTAAAATAPAKRPVAASVLRAVVRPVWGTATLPLRLLVSTGDQAAAAAACKDTCTLPELLQLLPLSSLHATILE
jgi:hypothetical protein